MNVQARIGHNEPPSAIDDARMAFVDLSAWLKDHPVIASEDEARSCKPIVDRTRATLKSLTDVKESETAPLYAAWKASGDKFKQVSEPLDKIFKELLARLTAFSRQEEVRRADEAEAKRKALEAAEKAAREAERLEQEAKDNAAQGEFVDVGVAVQDADTAFDQYQLAKREAARAEKAETFRIGGGFDRTMSMRTGEVLTVTDPAAALAALGLTAKIRDAMLSSARDHRKDWGDLPAGITAIQERKF